MRRPDYTMILELTAGSHMPFGPLVLHRTLGAAILFTASSAALVGVMFKLVWIDAPAG